MIVANITTQKMFDRLEVASNSPEQELAGRADAIVHIGWLVTGERTPEELAGIQEENLQFSASTRNYVKGYTLMWSEMYGLLF